MTSSEALPPMWYAIVVGIEVVVLELSRDEALKLEREGFKKMAAFKTKDEARAQAEVWSARIAGTIG